MARLNAAARVWLVPETCVESREAIPFISFASPDMSGSVKQAVIPVTVLLVIVSLGVVAT